MFLDTSGHFWTLPVTSGHFWSLLVIFGNFWYFTISSPNEVQKGACVPEKIPSLFQWESESLAHDLI